MHSLQFKTNAKCAQCVAIIGQQLNTVLTPDQWRIELTKPLAHLTVTADVEAEVVEALVKKAGFRCDPF
jgi:copper chaperone